jgi:hypothetical protein
MKTTTIVAVGAVLALAGATQAAIYIPFGTSSGSLAVVYNGGGPEVPTNQHYVRAQNSHTNTNGATFNFDNSFDLDPGAGVVTMRNIFQSDPDQFGLDLVLAAPTSLGGPMPTLTAVDHTGSGPAAAGSVAWALNNYFGTTIGPSNPANVNQNSLFRSDNSSPASIAFSNVTPIVGGFTVDVSGFLNSDGNIYWYTIGQPNSAMSAFFNDGVNYASGRIKFDGTLTYLTAGDTTPGTDFYDGTITYQLELVPAPGATALVGLGGAVMLRRRRK